jgi:acyl-CoA synthetase (AMP-forming)/AMP-acid ligase II
LHLVAAHARVNRLIRGFQAAGLGRGDRLVLSAGNSRAVFELMLAAHHAGLSYVPVNWHFTSDELAHVLLDAQAAAVFTDAQFCATAQQALLKLNQQADSKGQAIANRLCLCAEIEAALSSHPSVRDGAVIGVLNAEFGEEVKAIIQLNPGFGGGASLVDALISHCRKSLAGYKVPRSIEFRTECPRTETGKLQKRLLRERYWEGSGRLIQRVLN